MIAFFDTNILVFTSVNQNADRQKVSDTLIQNAIKNQTLVVSPLIISEYIFVLSKLNSIDANIDNINMFTSFVKGSIDANIVKTAFETCNDLGFCKNINDAIHLKFAEKYAEKLVTFDKDFNKLIPHSRINIEIL